MSRQEGRKNYHRNIHRSKIHPSHIYEPHSIAKHSSQEGAVTSELMLAPPVGENDISSFTAHVLLINLSNKSVRQVNRVADQEYDGVFPEGAFSCAPVGASVFAYWESTDDDLMFFITPDWLEKIARETGLLNPAKVELLPIAMKQDPQMEALGKLFQQELLNDFLGGALYYESLTNLLGIHLLRHYCAFDSKPIVPINGEANLKLRQAIAYIQEHLEQEISLGAIATYLGMSQYHFCRWFKQSMGVPPYQYVIGQRVERAKLLLQEPELSLTDVALRCGFNSQGHLIRHFKKQVGITPKKYREL